MSYKILILAPSAGGKSTLMRYLRNHTGLEVVETDEEVVKANHNHWPSNDKYKDEVLIPKTINKIIARDEVIYLMKDMPTELVKKARGMGFKVIILKVTLEQLNQRNQKRMIEEKYDDVSPWFEGQLKHLDDLAQRGLVDGYIDGNLTTKEIAARVIDLVKS